MSSVWSSTYRRSRAEPCSLRRLCAVLAPQRVGDAIHRYDVVGVGEEEGEKSSLPWGAEVELVTVGGHLERAQCFEFEPFCHGTPFRSGTACSHSALSIYLTDRKSELVGIREP